MLYLILRLLVAQLPLKFASLVHFFLRQNLFLARALWLRLGARSRPLAAPIAAIRSIAAVWSIAAIWSIVSIAAAISPLLTFSLSFAIPLPVTFALSVTLAVTFALPIAFPFSLALPVAALALLDFSSASFAISLTVAILFRVLHRLALTETTTGARTRRCQANSH